MPTIKMSLTHWRNAMLALVSTVALCVVFGTVINAGSASDVSTPPGHTASSASIDQICLEAAKIVYVTQDLPRSVTVADFNGDNALDVATVENPSNVVSVLINNGDGSLQAPATYAVGSDPVSVFSGDVNGDEAVDLAVANSGSDDVSVLLNNGDGTFQAAVEYASGNEPFSVFIADVDDDGADDLIVALRTANVVQILFNNGDGTFLHGGFYDTEYDPTSVFAADLNGDDSRDLAVVNSSHYSVSVLINNGDGTFQSRVTYAVGAFPWSVYGADFDGDDTIDLAVTNRADETISVLFNNGDGTFQPPVDLDTGDEPFSVFAADFDNDNDADLATANMHEGTASVFLNNGDGTFQSATEYSVGASPNAIVAADLDQDNDTDIVVGGTAADVGFVSLLLNNGDGTYRGSTTYDNTGVPVFVSDLNADGANDVIAGNAGTDEIYVYMNNGDGTFQAQVRYTVGDWPVCLFGADFNGDSDPDVAVANATSDDVSVLINDGTGSLLPAVNYAAGSMPYAVAAADLDGDNDNDLAVANHYSYDVSVLINNGNGTFQSPVNYSTGAEAGEYPRWVTAVDLDADNDVDLVGVSDTRHEVWILYNNGDGTYQAAVSYASGGTVIDVTATDLDNDSDYDLVVPNYTEHQVSLLFNNGDGTFQAPASFAVESHPYSSAAIHLNGDSFIDLAVDCSGSIDVALYLNNGDGTFRAAGRYALRDSPSRPFSAELNGDLSQDLAISTGNVVELLYHCGFTACDCPYQADFGQDGVDAADIISMVWILFAGSADTQDADCPTTRADYNGDGYANAVDLVMLTQFVNGPGGAPPVDPCTCSGGYPCDHPYSQPPGNMVVVTSKSATAGETGVEIPVLITNSADIAGLVVPLVVREVTPGSYITAMKLSWRDRLIPDPGPRLYSFRTTNQYSVEDGNCLNALPGGFGTILHSDTSSHPVGASPLGLLFGANRFTTLENLSAGSDVSGSLIMTVDVTTTAGTFEIDTTCTDPANHLLFVDAATQAGIIPSFTKGTITIVSSAEEADIPAEKDNMIYGHDGGWSNGAGDHFGAGTSWLDLPKERRGLVAFDVGSTIPSGSVIQSAELELYMSWTYSQAGDQTVYVHRLLSDWGEGTSVAPDDTLSFGGNATPGDATGVHTFYDTDYWTTPGGDFEPVASAQTVVGGVGYYTWSSPEIVADVQAWVDHPDSNAGWILIGNEAVKRTGKRFNSREHANADQRPVLHVRYTPPPCLCPYQCDYDEDGFLTALDLGSLIDVLFGGDPEIQDPSCPTSRGDADFDLFPTALDLGNLIDHLFSGADPPCDPCNPVQGTCTP